MSMHVIHANQRTIPGESQGFGGRHANQKAPHQAGTMSHTDCINLFRFYLSLPKCKVDDVIEPFDMRAGGNFRNNTSIFQMQRNLRTHNIGKYEGAVTNDCRTGFVAGGFNSNDNRHIKLNRIYLNAAAGLVVDETAVVVGCDAAVCFASSSSAR